MRDALANGFRNQGFLGVGGMNNPMYVWDQRAWNNSKDRQYLIRKPSFADPEEMAKRRKEITEHIRALTKYKPLSGILADETSLTSYTAEFDYDMHPANIEAFHKKLLAKFGTVAAMKCGAQDHGEIIRRGHRSSYGRNEGVRQLGPVERVALAQ